MLGLLETRPFEGKLQYPADMTRVCQMQIKWNCELFVDLEQQHAEKVDKEVVCLGLISCSF